MAFYLHFSSSSAFLRTPPTTMGRLLQKGRGRRKVEIEGQQQRAMEENNNKADPVSPIQQENKRKYKWIQCTSTLKLY